MRRFLIFLLYLVLLLQIGVAHSLSQGCSISSFTMTPEGQVGIGTHVFLEGRSSCGTTRFTVNGSPRAEIGNGNNTETLKTEEFGSGGYEVCFVARGDGGWERAARSCRSLYVQGYEGAPPGSTNTGNVLCWVSQFLVTPGIAQVGTTLQFSGYGQCDGNARASRFYINNHPYGESSLATSYASWGTNGYSAGNYEICFGITSDQWSEQALSCTQVTLTGGPQQPSRPAQGPQVTNGQTGQTNQSGPHGSTSTTPGGTENQGITFTDARQDIIGGVDINIWCAAMGYSTANNSTERWDGWKCGNIPVNWTQVCTDVWQTSQFTHQTHMYSIRCGGSQASGQTQGSNTGSSSLPEVGYSYRPQGEYVCVVTGRINIRTGPAISYESIAQAPSGTCFTFLGESNSWFQVSWGTGSGWVSGSSRYTQYGSSNTGASQNGTGTQSTTTRCSDLPSRLSTGMQAMVNDLTSDPANMRTGAGVSNSLVIRVPVRSIVVITGGPSCADGWVWWQVQYGTSQGWIAEVDNRLLYNLVPVVVSQNPPNSGNQSDTVRLSLYYQPFNHTYTLEVDSKSCTILNGSEVVANEIARFSFWRTSLTNLTRYPSLADYFFPYVVIYNGGVNELKDFFVSQISSSVRCQNPVYLVGQNYMDMSGVGNIVFGYYMQVYPVEYSSFIGDKEQGVNAASFLRFIDNADDSSQVMTGRRIGEYVGQNASPNPSIVERAAAEVGLFGWSQ